MQTQQEKKFGKQEIMWFLRGARNEFRQMMDHLEPDSERFKNLHKASEIALYLENFYTQKDREKWRQKKKP